MSIITNALHRATELWERKKLGEAFGKKVVSMAFLVLPIVASIHIGRTIDSDSMLYSSSIYATKKRDHKHLHRPLSTHIASDTVALTGLGMPSLQIQGDESFRNAVLRDLQILSSTPATLQFLEALSQELAQSSRGVRILPGNASQAIMVPDQDGVINIEISDGEAFGVVQDDRNNCVLEKINSYIILAHELTHVYHFIRHEYLPITTSDGFDDTEELDTIGTVDSVARQIFTENSYRSAFHHNLRVGHYGVGHDLPLTHEEEALAMRNSLQIGRKFTFLLYDTHSLKKIYKAAHQSSFIAKDIDLLVKHAQSTDGEKQAFAIEVLPAFLPLIQQAYKRQIVEKILAN